MAELDYVLLADGATQRPDGKLDVFGAGFDVIHAPTVPVRHNQLSIALKVLMSTHEAESNHQLLIVLMSEDGPEIARLEAEVAVPPEGREAVQPGDSVGIGTVINLVGLVFPAYGRYHLAVLWDGTELRQPVRLKVLPMPVPGHS